MTDTTGLGVWEQAAMDARQAYRAGTGGRDAHREASVELRYQRWVSRGGPAVEQARIGRGEQHTNGETGVLYARWLDERVEG